MCKILGHDEMLEPTVIGLQDSETEGESNSAGKGDDNDDNAPSVVPLG
jgi:hypothetical protein